MRTSQPRIVALGGGHGLYATLRALRTVTEDLTAIVTVSDDGGSSGRLREEFDIVPPGDLRMALSALCEDTEWGNTWAEVLQSRFVSEGPLHGHAIGNLLIAALWEHTGDVVQGLDWVAKLLRSRGRVLPLSSDPLTISVSCDGETEVVGQVAVATATGHITEVRLEPANPAVPDETVAAIDNADMVVLGPGSWYTSVMTHFVVSPVAQALVRANDRAVVTLNIAHEDEETAGTDRVDDIAALRKLAPEFSPALVLADTTHADDVGLADAVAGWGAHLQIAPMRAEGSVDRHDFAVLGEQYRGCVEQVGPQAPQHPRTMAR